MPVVTGVDDLQHIHVGKVGAGLRTVVVEHDEVVAADAVDVALPVFPVHGKQGVDDVQETCDQAAVALVAEGVHDLHGGVGFAGAGDAEEEQAFAPTFHFRKVFGVTPGVAGDPGAAAVIVSKVPVSHVFVGQGVAAAQFRVLAFLPPPAFFGDAVAAFSLAVAVDGVGFGFAKQGVQDVFGLVAVAAVQHAVFFVVPGVGAAAEGVFGDAGVAVLFPVVVGRAGDVVADFRRCVFGNGRRFR